MSSAFDLGSTGSAGLVDPVQTLLSSLGQHPALAPPNRIDHLAALHNAGMFNPNAGPASAAIAAHVAAHALSGMADPMAGVPLTPDATAPSPTLAPSAQVTTPGNDLGSQSPGRSFLDQLASGIADSRLPGPSGYQSNGDQFLTALLGTAMRSFAGAQGQDMSDREKLQNAMEARTSDLNRRNMDLADKKDLMATESGLQAKNEAARIKAESGARTAEDQAKQASSMVTVDRTLANLIGHPEMTGTSIDRDLRDRLIEIHNERMRAATSDSEAAGWTKSEMGQERILMNRLKTMEEATLKWSNVKNDRTKDPAARQDAINHLAVIDKDYAARQAELDDLRSRVQARLAGGKSPAAGTVKPAAVTKAAGLNPDTIAGGLLTNGIRTPDQFRAWLLMPSSADPGKTNAEHGEAIGIPPAALLSSWQKAIASQAQQAAAVAARGQAARQKVDAIMFPQTPLPAESERGAPGPLSRE